MLENLSPTKTLKYVAAGLGVLMVFILIKEIVLKPKPLVLEEVPLVVPPIKVDFSILDSPAVKDLSPFEEIAPPKRAGRENPFEPYPVGEIEEELATTTEGATTTGATTTETL